MKLQLAFQRRKCIIASVLVVEIVLFSTITFVIAYLSSLNAIHHTSQQLADSMVDTVSERITAYTATTELPVQRLATMHSDAVLPVDDHSEVRWYTRWVLELRTLMLGSNFGAVSYAMIFDDACITAVVTMHPQRWVLEEVLDGRTAAADGFRRATSTIWDIATFQNISTLGVPNATSYFPTASTHGLDLRSQQAPGYYYVKETYVAVGKPCFRAPLLIYYEDQRFQTIVACSVVNRTGAYMGQLSVTLTIAQLSSFLQQTAATPNTAIFIIDGSLFLTAATTATPTSTIVRVDAVVTAVSPGCVNSLTYGNTTPHAVVGCRSSALDYPYTPLQDLAKTDALFLTSPTRTSDYRPLAGSGYYFLVSLPIMQSLQLVLFLPESDVLGDVQQGVVLSIVVCALLCVIGAVLSSVLVATLIGQPVRLQRGSSEDTSAPTLPDATLMEYSAAYNGLIAEFRQQRRVGDGSLRALTAQPPRSPRPDALVVDAVEVTTNTDVPERAFILAVAGSPDVEDIARRQTPLQSITKRHGGEIVTVGIVVFHPTDVDDAATRAVLCGLALLEAELVSAAAVTSVLRGHTDVFTGGNVVQQASTLLSLATGRQVLVASGVYDGHCMQNVFVVTRCDDVTVGVEGVVDGAWRCVPRRVHFDRRESSLAVLIKEAARRLSFGR